MKLYWRPGRISNASLAVLAAIALLFTIVIETNKVVVVSFGGFSVVVPVNCWRSTVPTRQPGTWSALWPPLSCEMVWTVTGSCESFSAPVFSIPVDGSTQPFGTSMLHELMPT